MLMKTSTARSTAAPRSESAPYDSLKQLILDGTLAPGEPLIERTLAERLSVSRTPVREAIFRLEREGLIEAVDGKGAFVASYSIDDLIEIYQIREGLEPLAARLSCAHLDDADLDYHEKQLKRYRDTPRLREENPGKWLQLGWEFHQMFIRASNNARLIDVIERMQNQIELFRGLGRSVIPRRDMQSAVEEHWEIFTALRKRDEERAERAVRMHLQSGLQKRLEGLHGKISGVR
ncbi:MAG: GntR family transcriptional regulator [Burkholderiales bacterium]